jgi:hypothetical protein
MKTAFYRIFSVCLAGLCLFFPALSSLRAQPNAEQVERVFRDWQKRQERMQRIRYVVRGECIRPKGSYTDEMGRPLVPPQPPRDIAEKQDTVFLLDISGQRFRMERDHQTYWDRDKKLVPCLATTVFDSQSSYTAIPREENASAGYIREPSEADVTISKNDAGYRPLKAVNAYWLSPLLIAHGIVPQLAAAPSFVDKLDIDDFIAQGQAVYDGKPCLVLRTFPTPAGTAKCFDEYWVDLTRDSAVLRHSQYINDKLLTDAEIVYQQTSRGWLPQRWVGTTRDYTKGNIINLTRLNVQEFNIDPLVSDRDFQVDIKPGMLISVTEYTPLSQTNQLGIQRTMYRVDANGHWREIGKESNSPLRSLWGRLLSLAAIIAVIALAYLLWRRLRPGSGRCPTSPVR